MRYTIGVAYHYHSDSWTAEVTDESHKRVAVFFADQEAAAQMLAQRFVAADEIVALLKAFLQRMVAVARGEYVGRMESFYHDNAAMTRRMQEIAAIIEPA